MLRYMTTEQEKRSKWNEVKISIVKFILNFDGSVPEPDIRENLKKEYKITNRGNIKKHLSDLRYRPYSCIEIIPGKPGFANHWDIKTTENLKNILLYFPEIQLNEYDKSINIVLKKSSCNLFFPEPTMFKTQLVHSVSLFKACLEYEPEDLYDQDMLVYRFTAIFGEYQQVKKDLTELLSLYHKYHPDVEISDETFLKMPVKLSREILAETVEILPEELFEGNINKIAVLLSYLKKEYLESLDSVFGLNVSYDIFLGSLSPVEIESFLRVKEKCLLYRTELRGTLYQSTTNRILTNISLNLEKLNNLTDISAPKLATGWIEFHKCWLEEYKKFLEFENELEELNKKLEKLKKEYQQVIDEIKGSIEVVMEICNEPSKLDKETSESFSNICKKLQKLNEERQKLTINTPELSEKLLKLHEEERKLEEEKFMFAAKSPVFRYKFAKLYDLSEQINYVNKMRRSNLIRRLRGLKS